MASISCREGVSSIQYFIAIQCYMKSLFSRQSVVGRVCLAFNILSQYCAIRSLCSGSICCKKGVACGVQFCMKSLFWRQSVLRRVCLAFNTLSQYSAI